MSVIPSVSRSSADTKLRIILVAQDIFATKGYSYAGLREIAKLAEVAPSLVIKYYGTKARLFEDALRSAILPLHTFQEDRASLGEMIVAAVLDPGSRMVAPTMIALGSGDPEAREIVTRVVTEQVVVPMAQWLSCADADALALNILAMTTGFAVFHRSLRPGLSAQQMEASARQFARSLQLLVDTADVGHAPATVEHQAPVSPRTRRK
jgi:AcrR family transcriptional regulator